jgi:NTE family protein
MEGGVEVTLRSPVTETGDERLEEGIALCLSGGGYRAMLFHVGTLWRLNELGYLPRLARVSSVSGGSITAAALGLNWDELSFEGGDVASNFEDLLVAPIRRLAATTIDVGSVLEGLLPFGSIADEVAAAYRRRLFGDSTLQRLPDKPRFVINATNVQTGSLWRFSKPYMADYRVGMVRDPEVELAVAVAASSAFPPFLSPLELNVDPGAYDPAENGPLHQPPFTTDVVLTDGGVYDNLGLETAWKRCRTVLVSDGGGQMQAEGEVARDWARHAYRVNQLIDNQVRSLRKRQTIAGYTSGDRDGAYWSIRSEAASYAPLPPRTLPCSPAWTRPLAETPTRLAELDVGRQEALINWGYANCDVAMRRWVEPDATALAAFPYPAAAPA